MTNNRVNVSYGLTEKMKNIPAISTSIKANSFCQKMQKTECVCKHCYGKKLYSNSEKMYKVNYDLLTSGLLQDYQLPLIQGFVCRFNAFGELENLTHLLNLYRICEINENVTFTLWTKRPNFLTLAYEQGYKKPSNLIVILSDFKVDNLENIDLNKVEPYGQIDKVFRVYTKEFATENNIVINCGANSCATCRKCYTKNDKTKVINELLK